MFVLKELKEIFWKLIVICALLIEYSANESGLSQSSMSVLMLIGSFPVMACIVVLWVVLIFLSSAKQ